MTDQHPITPPPELRKLWAQQAQRLTPHDINGWLDYVATQAAQWGADQELAACCEEMKSLPSPFGIPFGAMASNALRAARRPKPPSLKEQALAVLEEEPEDAKELIVFDTDQVNLIRRALEALPND